MVEMAASASLAARSLAASVPGAGSRRNETFGVPSSVNSVAMPPPYEASKQSLPLVP
jgi:hypothetical protein